MSWLLKQFIRFAEALLGKAINEDEPRADMYLPLKALIEAFVFIIAAVALLVYGLINAVIWALAVGAALLILGIVMFLCWRNQSITVLTSEHFEYKTFLGNKKTYRFGDITRLRKNSDSMTLFVAGDKLHMEAMAIISDRLAEAIDARLKEIYAAE